MRIVFDVDGTICEIKKPNQSYADVLPLTGAVETIRALHAAGHYIIIHSARNMGTCESNMGRVMKNVGLITLEWLQKHGIEYDEIYFGKPNGHVYVDDRALRYSGWEGITVDTLEKAAGAR